MCYNLHPAVNRLNDYLSSIFQGSDLSLIKSWIAFKIQNPKKRILWTPYIISDKSEGLHFICSLVKNLAYGENLSKYVKIDVSDLAYFEQPFSNYCELVHINDPSNFMDNSRGIIYRVNDLRKQLIYNNKNLSFIITSNYIKEIRMDMDVGEIVHRCKLNFFVCAKSKFYEIEKQNLKSDLISKKVILKNYFLSVDIDDRILS